MLMPCSVLIMSTPASTTDSIPAVASLPLSSLTPAQLVSLSTLATKVLQHFDTRAARIARGEEPDSDEDEMEITIGTKKGDTTTTTTTTSTHATDAS